MNLRQKHCILLLLLTFGAFAANKNTAPVTPNASAEAQDLLNLIYAISGNQILTGQHNYPDINGRNTMFAKSFLGKTPVIYSLDWGFAKEGDKDSYLARPKIVEEAIYQHSTGAIITFCWHAVPPTANEPVTFRPVSDSVPAEALESVQGQLTDEQFKEVLTPGTTLYNNWCRQVDTIAVYLKRLQDAHVPVLWRPYHEMNGSWFWWGGRLGEFGTAALYRQLFERLVTIHKINNLIWVWNVDRPHNTNMNFSNYYPGNNFLDIVSIDIYGRDFKQSFYDSLLYLSQGKPMAFGEVGNPPSVEILKKQPLWSYFVIWAGMVRNTSKKEYDTLAVYAAVMYKEDSVYKNLIATYFHKNNIQKTNSRLITNTDFSGEWIFNEERSKLEHTGATSLPAKLKILMDGYQINIQKTYIQEYAGDKITDELISLKSKNSNYRDTDMHGIKKARWSNNSDTLYIDSKLYYGQIENPKSLIEIKECISLKENGNVLEIGQVSKSNWGERSIKMIFNKQ